MTFVATVLTLYPEMFPGPLGVSLAGRAMAEGTWALDTVQIRDFAYDKHRTVDDTPAGGGAGMVLRVDVLAKAIDHARAFLPGTGRGTTEGGGGARSPPPGLPVGAHDIACPSTILRMIPFPRWGRKRHQNHFPTAPFLAYDLGGTGAVRWRGKGRWNAGRRDSLAIDRKSRSNSPN